MRDLDTLEKKVNQLAEQMYLIDVDRNAALWNDLRMELWELLYCEIIPTKFIYPRVTKRKNILGYDDPIFADELWSQALESIEYCLAVYDPSRGPSFMNLFSKTIAARLNGVGKTFFDEKSKESRSLNAPIDTEDSGATVGDLIHAGESFSEASSTFGFYLDAMAAIVHGLSSSNWKPGDKMRRADWYSLFLTEYVTMLAQRFGIISCGHMRDLFSAMMLPYQDHFSEGAYRTLQEIAEGQLKPLGVLNPFCDPDDRDKVIIFEDAADTGKLLFPAGISLFYLGYWKTQEDARKQKGASGRSNYLSEFKSCLIDAGLGVR